MTTQQIQTENYSDNSCILVSNRPWNRDMINALVQRSGYKFIIISDPRELTYQKMISVHPRYVFFPHWSHRIDKSIYDQFECVIFHMTDLPFGRGGSPLQNLIARGIYETKITALRCVEAMDAGPIYFNKPLSLYGSAEEIYLRTSSVIEEMIVELLAQQHEPLPQVGLPTVFKRRKAEESDLSNAHSLVEVFDKIRMLDAEGYPNAVIHIGALKIEFTRASMKTDCVISDVRISIIDKAEEKEA